MPMGQSHFVPMDFEPSWRLRQLLGRLWTVGLQVTDTACRTIGREDEFQIRRRCVCCLIASSDPRDRCIVLGELGPHSFCLTLINSPVPLFSNADHSKNIGSGEIISPPLRSRPRQLVKRGDTDETNNRDWKSAEERREKDQHPARPDERGCIGGIHIRRNRLCSGACGGAGYGGRRGRAGGRRLEQCARP